MQRKQGDGEKLGRGWAWEVAMCPKPVLEAMWP